MGPYDTACVTTSNTDRATTINAETAETAEKMILCVLCELCVHRRDPDSTHTLD